MGHECNEVLEMGILGGFQAACSCLGSHCVSGLSWRGELSWAEVM